MIAEYLSVIVFLFTLIWCVQYYNTDETKKRKKLKYFNGPIRFPIIGSALQFFAITARHNLNDSLAVFKKKYGPMCGMYVGSHYFVFVQDPFLGKDILNQDDMSRKFPATSITYKLYGDKNLGISQGYGEVLKEMRRFANRNLKRFGFGKLSAMDDIIAVEADKYLAEFEKQRVENDGIIHMNDSFYLSTLNILWVMMSGMKFSTYDKKLKDIIATGRLVLKEDPVGSLLVHGFQFIRLIPGLTVFKEAQSFWKNIRLYLQEVLDVRRALGTYKTNPTNFIDMFLVEIEKGDNPIYTDAQCVQTCMDLFVAGLDSTANTLDWVFLYLISYPEVYAKVEEEIDSVIGYERRPNVNDRFQMPYTEATILEVMRIANVISFTMRAPLYETTFKDYHIPANTHLLVKISCFHDNKEIWGDPENFRPERFLDENQNIINSEKIFTFGFGKRVCIGENSSKMSIFVFLTTVLQKYSLKQSPKHPRTTLEPEKAILVSHPADFYILATKK